MCALAHSNFICSLVFLYPRINLNKCTFKWLNSNETQFSSLSRVVCNRKGNAIMPWKTALYNNG